MKYWSIACKLQLYQENKDPESLKKRTQVIFVIGLLYNAVGGIVYPLPFLFLNKPWLKYFAISMQLGIILSCIFLFDAFRRLKKVKRNNQVISKKQVVFLSIAFGAFGFITFVELMTLSESLVSRIVLVLWQLAFLISCLLLAKILQSLISMQALKQLAI